ncbi:MAG TPA: signal peptidase I [Candidatus Moranbacteria bacterium]|nr:MAG: Signal peptidase I [Candidatus Moranbacteria bacterium GW2011_GWC2_45_10]KKT95265.1 MAG: Signal peptidase I [Parcubacteria group bacterium GW2011_GWC1_45_14]HAV10956.1 signal peptidase I [Candidatus Moranbacteria bacterium]
MMENNNRENLNPDINNEEEVYYGVGSFIWEVVKVFFWALIIIVPIRVFLFQPFFVQGASMEPNFADGDYLIVNEIGFKKTEVGFNDTRFFTVEAFNDFERGDSIVFRYPKNPSQFFIKRVIALPGEKVEVDDGKVYIFNEENPEGFFLDESEYLAEGVVTRGAVTRELKNDEYFVMGDNREFSHDSRAWGPITKDDAIGKVLLRAWPVSNADIF